MELNNCRLDRDGIKLEYLEGITLEEKLDELLAKGEMEKLEELFFFYLKKIEHIHSRDAFRKTRESWMCSETRSFRKDSAQAVFPISTLFQPIF